MTGIAFLIPIALASACSVWLPFSGRSKADNMTISMELRYAS
jgi:hypothetical protein